MEAYRCECYTRRFLRANKLIFLQYFVLITAEHVEHWWEQGFETVIVLVTPLTEHWIECLDFSSGCSVEKVSPTMFKTRNGNRCVQIVCECANDFWINLGNFERDNKIHNVCLCLSNETYSSVMKRDSFDGMSEKISEQMC